MVNTNSKINIAIDGPAGAGKSTVAREVAKQLNYIYIDTGAMYRAVTLKVLRSGLQPSQSDEISQLLESTHIQLRPRPDGQQVWLDGEDVTSQLRSQEVNQFVSQIARIEGVRTKLVNHQKKLSEHKGVVMDGRDIGSHVLPDAEVKIYLTASTEERAKRRFLEMKSQDPNTLIELAELQKDIEARDEMDRTREISPLIIAEDATVVDTSHLSIQEVVEQLVLICRKRIMAGD